MCLNKVDAGLNFSSTFLLAMILDKGVSLHQVVSPFLKWKEYYWEDLIIKKAGQNLAPFTVGSMRLEGKR